MLNTKKRQKQAEAARGGRGRRHEARGEFPQHADDDDKQNNNNSGSKATKKKQEQERATFRPAAKTITKAGGATCCCCYCCCHKPQHNSKVYATHKGKLHKSAAQHNCQQQGGGNGREGERSDVIGSRARHQIIVCRMLQLLLLLLLLPPPPSSTLPAVATKFNCLTLHWPRLQVGSTCNSYRKMLFPFAKAN